jgi:hypothetical protein
LGWRAFKQTPTPARKQGVPTKKQWLLAHGLSPKGNVTEGVAWHFMNLQCQAMPVKLVTLLKALSGYGHLLEGWAQHTRPGLGHQLGQAARVIGVVVRD